jgi:hypothetical protein
MAIEFPRLSGGVDRRQKETILKNTDKIMMAHRKIGGCG